MRKAYFRKKMVAVIIGGSMVLSLLACSDSGGNENTGSSAADTGSQSEPGAEISSGSETDAGEVSNVEDVTTLTGFIAFGPNTGAAQKATWYTDYLKENLGIALDFQEVVGTTSDQIMQSLMASGELPDIVGFDQTTFASNAAEAGLLLNLDEYKEQLPSIYENEVFTNALAYSRDNLGGGKEGVYLLPTEVGVRDDTNYNPQLRWDLYKKAGMPEIKTLEDYIPVLKEMQEANPTTDDGQPIYGISLFSDWDSNNMALATFTSALYGVDSEYVSPFTEVSVDGTGEVSGLLDDNSVYKRVLDFYFAANQAGIMDPDSITQKWETVSEKYKNGQVLFSPWEWAAAPFNVTENTEAEDFKGYQAVWADDFMIPIWPDATTGRSWTLGVSSSTKNVDAALKFIDFLYSYDAVDLLFNGPEGELWETGDDGMRHITEEGWNILDDNLELSGGGTILDAFNIINSPSMTAQSIRPDSDGQTMSNSYWESVLMHRSSKLIEDWRSEHDGAVNMFHYAKDNNQNLIKSTAALNLMPSVPDDLQMTMSQVGEVIKTNSWKMVYAKDQAEYDALWKEMQEKAEGLGLNEIVDWAQTEFQGALEKVEKYQ